MEEEDELIVDDSDEDDIDEEIIQILGEEIDDGRIVGSFTACIKHAASFSEIKHRQSRKSSRDELTHVDEDGLGVLQCGICFKLFKSQ